ncbi:unnamed protein product [Somion occarium]|uniref:Uncharacterized protein n=1 Tax=Somion occarium TaxID=3059160 RepID=A0ABP1E333_9APHY
MATYYSAFFSSGLLANSNDPFARPSTPETATPRSNATNLSEDTTPTATSSSSTYTLSSIVETAPSPAPVLRRRRSSITLGASPVSSIKARSSANTAQKLHTLMSASSGQGSMRLRARAGSVHESVFSRVAVAANDATEGNSLMGRLRSGSIGTALRPRRQLRKTLPAPPPPTVPLPALPPCPPMLTLNIPSSTGFSSSQPPSTPRRPLTHRSRTTDNLLIPIETPPMSRSSPRSGAEDFSMTSPNVGFPTGGRDYPSPIETPDEKNITGYFFSADRDTQMKEN